MKKSILKYYPFFALLLLCVFYTWKAMGFPIHDFANYYFGGKFLAESHFNSGIYFPYGFNKAISNLGYQHIFASYAPNTPFLAFLFMPFSFLALGTAKLVFNIISIALFVVSIFRLFSFYRINPTLVLLIPILFLVPIKNNLLFGQVYFLLFFLLAEGWLAYEKGYWKPMACFWGLAILLKVFPVLLLVFLAFKKKGNYIFATVLFCCCLIGISFLFTGIDIWYFYLKVVLPKASNGEISTAFVSNYQSVFMFLKELLVFDPTDNHFAIFNYPFLFLALMAAFKVGIITLGYFISKREYNLFFVFAYWILAMILLSPYGSTYTFILLLISFLAFIKSDSSNIKKAVFCAFLFLINNIPLSIFINKDFPFSYLRLLLLLLLFILFLTEVKQKVSWKTVTVFTLTSMVFILVFNTAEVVKSTILLKNGPVLVYDYTFETNNKTRHKYLKGNFWDGTNKVLFLKQDIQNVQALNLKDNQVFYKGKQFTFDKSNKLKPMLIDNKTLIYLSDYDRGIGFYTLRKIKLH